MLTICEVIAYQAKEWEIDLNEAIELANNKICYINIDEQDIERVIHTISHHNHQLIEGGIILSLWMKTLIIAIAIQVVAVTGIDKKDLTYELCNNDSIGLFYNDDLVKEKIKCKRDNSKCEKYNNMLECSRILKSKPEPHFLTLSSEKQIEKVEEYSQNTVLWLQTLRLTSSAVLREFEKFNDDLIKPLKTYLTPSNLTYGFSIICTLFAATQIITKSLTKYFICSTKEKSLLIKDKDSTEEVKRKPRSKSVSKIETKSVSNRSVDKRSKSSVSRQKQQQVSANLPLKAGKLLSVKQEINNLLDNIEQSFEDIVNEIIKVKKLPQISGGEFPECKLVETLIVFIALVLLSISVIVSLYVASKTESAQKLYEDFIDNSEIFFSYFDSSGNSGNLPLTYTQQIGTQIKFFMKHITKEWFSNISIIEISHEFLTLNWSTSGEVSKSIHKIQVWAKLLQQAKSFLPQIFSAFDNGTKTIWNISKQLCREGIPFTNKNDKKIKEEILKATVKSSDLLGVHLKVKKSIKRSLKRSKSLKKKSSPKKQIKKLKK